LIGSVLEILRDLWQGDNAQLVHRDIKVSGVRLFLGLELCHLL
jgi:hypothetical protein